MARVLGVGGVFFKASDPAALGAWYREHLGLEVDASWGGCTFPPSGMPAGSYTVWSPFKADTEYFKPSDQAYMINLIVDDLEAALGQVEAAGATLVGEPALEEGFGYFGWFLDPEGNKIELWQPECS